MPTCSTTLLWIRVILLVTAPLATAQNSSTDPTSQSTSRELITITDESFIYRDHGMAAGGIGSPLKFFWIPANTINVKNIGTISSEGFYIAEFELTNQQFQAIHGLFEDPITAQEHTKHRMLQMVDLPDAVPTNAKQYFSSPNTPMIGATRSDAGITCDRLTAATGLKFTIPTLSQFLIAQEWSRKHAALKPIKKSMLVLPRGEVAVEPVLKKYLTEWPKNSWRLSSLFDGPPEIVDLTQSERGIVNKFLVNLVQRMNITTEQDPQVFNYTYVSAGPAHFIFPNQSWISLEPDLQDWFTFGLESHRPTWSRTRFATGIRLVMKALPSPN